jgi:uncharacterized protein YuzE
MTIQIDKVADAAYIRLAEGVPFESDEVESGVVLDYDRSGKVIAIELLAVSKSLPEASLAKVEVITG